MNGRAFEEIYDIYAIRLIVDTVFDCYNILGIIHDMFRADSQSVQRLYFNAKIQYVSIPAYDSGG